ncbi:T9SS type A sorting domain-containing protein [Flavobacterium pedocola]
MKKTIQKTSKQFMIACLLLVVSIASQAQTLSMTGSNAVSLSAPVVSGSTYTYNVVIPFYETNLTGTYNLTYSGTFSCGLGYYKHITLHKGSMFVAQSSYSNAVSFSGAIPLGSNVYTMKVYCANSAPDLPSQLIATRYININVTKEATPAVSLSLSPYCKTAAHVSPPQYNGYIGFNVSGNYSNAGKLYLRVMPAGACPQYDYPVVYLNNSGLATAVVGPGMNFYDCSANTTYNVKMVYKSSGVSGNIEVELGTGSIGTYGWTNYSWTKTFKSCLNKLEPIPDEPIELKSATVVYPNPVKDVVNVKVGEGEKILSVSVLDFSNTIQKNVAAKRSVSEQSIEVANLRNGIYILEIVTDKGVKREKFIKE